MADKFLGRRLIAAARLHRYEHLVETAISRALTRRRLAVQARALTAAGGDNFDEDAWDTDIADEVEPVIAEILAEITKGTVGQFPLGAAAARVLGRIDLDGQAEQFIRVIRGIGPDAARRINDALAHGVGLGESVPQLAERVDAVFAMMERRASMIARTETNKAANLGINEAAAAINTEVPITKSWLATDDDRTRDTHIDAEADNQDVPFDDPFIVGGYECQYPGDPDLPPEEVINCRCTMTLDMPGDDELPGDQQTDGVDVAG